MKIVQICWATFARGTCGNSFGSRCGTWQMEQVSPRFDQFFNVHFYPNYIVAPPPLPPAHAWNWFAHFNSLSRLQSLWNWRTAEGREKGVENYKKSGRRQPKCGWRSRETEGGRVGGVNVLRPQLWIPSTCMCDGKTFRSALLKVLWKYENCYCKWCFSIWASWIHLIHFPIHCQVKRLW